MPHFFCPPGSIRGGRFVLGPDESRHLASVLRKKPGDEVRLFDGRDAVYVARLEKVSPARVEGKIFSEEKAVEAPYRLRLFQGLPKGDKFELVLEKMTELGAAEVVPVYTERSEVRVPADRLEARLARWRKIVLGAAKQSGRVSVPEVAAPLKFAEALAACRPGELTLLPWESEQKTTLKAALRNGAVPALGAGIGLFSKPGGNPSPGKPVVNVFIGPEGGFTEAEAALAVKRGAVAVTLGESVLRTETAGLFVASCLLYELGL